MKTADGTVTFCVERFAETRSYFLHWGAEQTQRQCCWSWTWVLDMLFICSSLLRFVFVSVSMKLGYQELFHQRLEHHFLSQSPLLLTYCAIIRDGFVLWSICLSDSSVRSHSLSLSSYSCSVRLAPPSGPTVHVYLLCCSNWVSIRLCSL